MNRKHVFCPSSTFSDLLPLTQRKKLINSEIGGTKPSPAAAAMPADKGSQQGRETWVGLILVESVGARENCTAQQATYGTQRAFSTLIAKLFQEIRLSCHQPLHVQPTTFLQPEKSDLPRLTAIFGFTSHGRKPRQDPQNHDGKQSPYKDLSSRMNKISAYLIFFFFFNCIT